MSVPTNCCCGCSTRRGRGSTIRSRCASAAPAAPEKVVQSLSIYSAKDIATMTTPEGRVTADCQFCGAHYEFDPDELGVEGRRRMR